MSGGTPPELGDLANLTWLDLRDNQLSGEIRPELDNFANVTWLDLRDNQLSGVPSSLSDRVAMDASYGGDLRFCP